MVSGPGAGAAHVAREVSAGYGELALVEMPAIDLLTSLGWRFKNLYAETFGELGSEGRESESQVILTRRLRAALEALNPGLPADAYAQAIEQLAQDRSKQIAVNANRDFYRLLKDGVKVKVPDEHGGHGIETLRVIDWATPANNEFFLASQMWVAGDMYRRRCDLLGFVNGLPLVFIELKKPAVPLKSAFDDNLRDYRGQSVPQLFHPNAFILLSQRLGHQGGHAHQRLGALLRVEARRPTRTRRGNSQSWSARCAACWSRRGCWTTSRTSPSSRRARAA